MNKLLFKLRLWIKGLFQKKGLLSVKGIVCYVCGNEEFLSPLEVEEEKELLVRKEAGDSLATEKLIEHNLRLVAYIARKFDNANIDYEDLIAIGAIGLIKAVKTFKSDKNIRLATYASRCIENEILMQLRKTTKLKNDISGRYLIYIYSNYNTSAPPCQKNIKIFLIFLARNFLPARSFRVHEKTTRISGRFRFFIRCAVPPRGLFSLQCGQELHLLQG